MSEMFTHVISSEPLLNDSIGEWDTQTCPREFLGLTCMVPAYSCLCGLVEKSRVETVTEANGKVEVVNLTLGLTPGASDPQAVMRSIDMIGYKADYRVSHNEVVASFNLRRPQNDKLRSFIRNGGV